MIEYGAYPSFYLTTEPSHLLAKTPSRDIYTSMFDTWKEEVVQQYELVQQSLGKVKGETIEARHVHEPGVVEVLYSNGISIIVNYQDNVKEVHDVKVDAVSFIVLDRGEQR